MTPTRRADMLRRLELKVPPPLVWTVLAALSLLLAHFVPEPALRFPGYHVLAGAAIAAGAGLALAGVREFRKARTTLNPHAPARATTLVHTGVYRFTRNPMYLGLAFALFGVGACQASLPGIALVPVFCAYLNRFQIGPEERVLQAAFGAEFSAYRARVRRWL